MTMFKPFTTPRIQFKACYQAVRSLHKVEDYDQALDYRDQVVEDFGVKLYKLCVQTYRNKFKTIYFPVLAKLVQARYAKLNYETVKNCSL